MLKLKHKRFLKKIFPGDGCLLDPEALPAYGVDSSRIIRVPWAVVRPESREQVVELMAWADRERIPVYPRARATGVAGGAVPALGGVVVSTLRMNRILEVSPDDFTATVQPGVITGELQAELARQHLLYPPDPASVKISTIGGNAATCAGGMRAVKYGVTRDWILGIEAVIPGGKVVRTGGKTHKNVVGLDLTRLFVGSEGTLGIFTELTLKLLPLPEGSASVMVGFDSLDDCLKGARSVSRAGFLPTAMEFMDGGVLRAIENVAASWPWDEKTGGALLFKLDGTAEGVKLDVKRLAEVLADASPRFLEVGDTPEAEERLWDLRRSISPAMYTVNPDKSNDDIAVPRGSIAEAVARFGKIGEECDVPVLCFGHLGDGNIHVDIMYDASRGNEKQRADKAKRMIYRAVLDLGGTLSGEHGVGMTKLPYISNQIGETERSLMHGIKRVFDPNNIMNPGKAY